MKKKWKRRIEALESAVVRHWACIERLDKYLLLRDGEDFRSFMRHGREPQTVEVGRLLTPDETKAVVGDMLREKAAENCCHRCFEYYDGEFCPQCFPKLAQEEAKPEPEWYKQPFATIRIQHTDQLRVGDVVLVTQKGVHEWTGTVESISESGEVAVVMAPVRHNPEECSMILIGRSAPEEDIMKLHDETVEMLKGEKIPGPPH